MMNESFRLFVIRPEDQREIAEWIARHSLKSFVPGDFFK
jgi:hypothetical protein